MSDNRIFSKMACTVCGRLGDPHAEWCDEIKAWLRSLPTSQFDPHPWRVRT